MHREVTAFIKERRQDGLLRVQIKTVSKRDTAINIVYMTEEELNDKINKNELSLQGEELRTES